MKKYRVPSAIICEKFEAELMLMSIEREYFFSLNATGAQIWNWLEEGIDISEIIQRFEVQYELSHEKANSEVLAFLEELRSRNLVIVDED